MAKKKDKKTEEKLKPITVELTFQDQERNFGGFRTEWLSCEHEGKKYELLGSAGLGSSLMYFVADGKRYMANVAPLFEQLIKSVHKK